MHLHPPALPSLKRRSFGDIGDHVPKRQALQSPIEAQGYPASRSFGGYGVAQSHHQLQPPSQLQLQPHLHHASAPPSLPQLQPQPPPQPVNIQPRPPPNGFVSPHPTSSPTVATSTPTGPTPKSIPSSRKPNPTGRRRGRPSKADREAWARANATQPTGYAPIIPAPAAPAPASVAPQPSLSPSQPQPQLQGAYSPGQVGASAYQVFATERSPEHGSRSIIDAPSTAPEDQRYESVPRSVRTVASPGTSEQHEHNDGQVRAEGEGRNIREPTVESGQRTPTGQPAFTQLEAPIQHTTTLDRHSSSPFAASALRGVIGPSMDHARSEGHPTVANQA
jgi:hypothetical protein